MDKNKLLELINLDLDGIISEKDKKELDKYLKTNPEAEKIYSDMQKLSKMLHDEAELEPPLNIKKTVMNEILSHKLIKESFYNKITNFFKTFLRSIDMNSDPTKKRRIVLVSTFVAVLALAIVVIALFTPVFKTAQQGETVDGTIGKVKKYYSAQMTEKDIVLRNALLNYKEDLNKAIGELKDYKKFLNNFNDDMGVWISKLSVIETKAKEKNAPDKELKLVKNQLILLNNSREIVSMQGKLDSLIMMFEDLGKIDTLNKNFPIENFIVDVNKYMNVVKDRFILVVNELPSMSEIFVKYGEKPIVVLTKAKEAKGKNNKLFTSKNINQLFLDKGSYMYFTEENKLYECCNKDNQIAFLSKDIQGVCLTDNILPFIEEMEAQVKQSDKTILFTKEKNSIIVEGTSSVILSKDNQIWILIENKDNKLFSNLVPYCMFGCCLFDRDKLIGEIFMTNLSNLSGALSKDQYPAIPFF